MRSLFISFLLMLLAALPGCAGPGVTSGHEIQAATRGEDFGLYERHGALQRLRARLDRLRARSDRIERLSAEQAALLLTPDLAPEERRTLVLDLKQLTEERAEVALRIDALEGEAAEAERDYEDYRRHIAALSGG